MAQGRFGPNEWLVDEIYQQYLADRESVDPAWWDFFADYTPADGSALKAQLDHAAANGHGAPVAAAPAAPAPAAPASAAPAPAAPAASDPSIRLVTSPMVGTYYCTPSPENPPFVTVGSPIKADSVVCIIEAMKVMNEIQAEISGTVVECLVANGTSVEFGQPLFRVKVS